MSKAAARAQAKLNELLGLTTVAKEVEAKANGRNIGVTEDEIQEFREVQGFVYFLQAPTLFQAKTCKHCGDVYLVSRMYVAYCSYTCISKELESVGIEWRKGRDLETLAQDPSVYHGNEPLWIRKSNLEKGMAILQNLLSTSEVKDSPSTTNTVVSSPPERTTTLSTEPPSPSSSPPTTTTPIVTVTPQRRSSKKSAVKRKISFNG